MLLLVPQTRSIGAMSVGRLLPVRARRAVGPFVFFDRMGPIDGGAAADVLPHPHIGLATVTYLFAGTIDHRDSLGSHQAITPGAINWMTAGRGIVHSERMPSAMRTPGARLHGLQLWVALPDAHEEMPPEFHHHAADTLPALTVEGAQVRLLAGAAFGAVAPVRTFSPLFYAEAHVAAGAPVPLPDGDERAVYVVDGAVAVGGERVEADRLVVLDDGERVTAASEARVMLLGGASVGPRHIEWNFVSSSRERIEQARRDWRERRFPLVPGDEDEWVPLP